MTPQQLNAIKLGLEALETCEWVDDGGNGHAEFDPGKVIAAAMEIKEALAEHAMQEVQRLGQEIEQEPVIDKSAAKRIATALGWTPQRTWVGLTDEEISEIAINNHPMVHEFARAIEAKLKEKNT